jgi:hypothetical protein
MMLPHGPDRDAFEGASNADLKPHKLDNTMSFMFETRFPQHLTEFAAKRRRCRTTTSTAGRRSRRSSTARRARSDGMDWEIPFIFPKIR